MGCIKIGHVSEEKFEKEGTIQLCQGLMVQNSLRWYASGFMSKGMSFMYFFETCILDGMEHA